MPGGGEAPGSRNPRLLSELSAEEYVLYGWNDQSSEDLEKDSDVQIKPIVKAIYLLRPELIPSLGEKAQGYIVMFAEQFPLLQESRDLRGPFIATPNKYELEPVNPDHQIPYDIMVLVNGQRGGFNGEELRRMLVFIDLSKEPDVFREIVRNYNDPNRTPDDIATELFSDYPHVIPNELAWSNKVARWINYYRHNQAAFRESHEWMQVYLPFCFKRGFRTRGLEIIRAAIDTCGLMNYNFFEKWKPIITLILDNFNPEDADFSKRVDFAFTYSVMHYHLPIAQFLKNYYRRPNLYHFYFPANLQVDMPEEQVDFLLGNGFTPDTIRIWQQFTQQDVPLILFCLMQQHSFDDEGETINDAINHNRYSRIIRLLVETGVLNALEPRADLGNKSPYDFLEDDLALKKYFKIKYSLGEKRFKPTGHYSQESSGVYL